MTTTVDNNQRVFQIISSTQKQWFCNLCDINKIIAQNGLNEGYYKVYHFWDNKPKIASKKLLNEMFAANGIDQNCKLVSVDVRAFEWFDKVNGNSYFAGKILVNAGMENEVELDMPFQYGYGDQYRQAAIYVLFKNNFLLSDLCNGPCHFSEYCKKNGIKTTYRKTENCKKADLKSL